MLHAGAGADLKGNRISMNAGAGLFAHAGAHTTLNSNRFHGNRGDAVAGRPGSLTVLSDADARCRDAQCAVTPAIVRRQRVPFDWTVGGNVTAEDKSLAERVAEMREQYEATRDDKTGSGLMMLPPGADPSLLCLLQ